MTAAFQVRRVEVLASRDSRGRRIWLIDLVTTDNEGEARLSAGEFHIEADAQAAAREFERSALRGGRADG